MSQLKLIHFVVVEYHSFIEKVSLEQQASNLLAKKIKFADQVEFEVDEDEVDKDDQINRLFELIVFTHDKFYLIIGKHIKVQVGVMVSCLTFHLWDPCLNPTRVILWIRFSVPA